MRVEVAGRFDIPDEITAAAVTVTATNVAADGFVTAYPAGTPVPSTSTLNPRARSDLANSAIVVVGDDGAIDVRSTLRIDTAIDLIVDVTGVFVPDDSARAGRFVRRRAHPHLRFPDTRGAGHGRRARHQHQPAAARRAWRPMRRRSRSTSRPSVACGPGSSACARRDRNRRRRRS